MRNQMEYKKWHQPGLHLIDNLERKEVKDHVQHLY